MKPQNRLMLGTCLLLATFLTEKFLIPAIYLSSFAFLGAGIVLVYSVILDLDKIEDTLNKIRETKG